MRPRAVGPWPGTPPAGGGSETASPLPPSRPEPGDGENASTLPPSGPEALSAGGATTSLEPPHPAEPSLAGSGHTWPELPPAPARPPTPPPPPPVPAPPPTCSLPPAPRGGAPGDEEQPDHIEATTTAAIWAVHLMLSRSGTTGAPPTIRRPACRRLLPDAGRVRRPHCPSPDPHAFGAAHGLGRRRARRPINAATSGRVTPAPSPAWSSAPAAGTRPPAGESDDSTQ